MCLMDDTFMSVVLQHKECIELVLRIILEKDDLTVTECKSQNEIHNLKNRSVRLDVFAVDSENRKYDIEVQRTDSGALPQRARYLSSLIDADSLEKSEKFEDLPETYVIFITENDVLKEKLPIYAIERRFKAADGTYKLFNDKEHIIYVNSQIQNETPLGRLMRDFYCIDPKNMYYSVLAEQSNFYKNTDEGGSSMCKIVEDIAKEYAEDIAKDLAMDIAKDLAVDIAKEKQEETVVKMLRKNMPIDVISEIMEFSVEEIERLKEKYCA